MALRKTYIIKINGGIKLLLKEMFLLLLLALSAVQATDLIKNCKRVILHRKSYPPPVNSIMSVSDPAFARALAYQGGRIYKPADIALLRVEFDHWIKATYNIDFSKVVASGTLGGLVLPEALAIPFTNGDNLLYRKIFDDKNPLTGFLNTTFVFDIGWLAVMSKNGNFTGGTMAGKPYIKGDLLWFTQYMYLLENEINYSIQYRTKELIKVRSTAPGKSVTTVYGTDLAMQTQVVDSKGAVGFGTINTVNTMVEGVLTQIIHTYLVWK